MRASLRRLAPAATSTIDPPAARERALIIGVVVLLHAALLLALRAAMQPMPMIRGVESAPLQITFIERRATIQPAQKVLPLILHPLHLPQQSVARADALQAVTIAPRAAAAELESPRASLYASDGALLAPVAPTPPPPRDLMAHHSASWMLPGGGRIHSHDFHVRQGTSPQDVVNTAGRVISALLANSANATRSDINGITPTAADRGLRTSDRDSDPCEDIALNMVNLEDADVRKEAEERYEQSCEGH